jgi:hypothetical protein
VTDEEAAAQARRLWGEAAAARRVGGLFLVAVADVAVEGQDQLRVTGGIAGSWEEAFDAATEKTLARLTAEEDAVRTKHERLLWLSAELTLNGTSRYSQYLVDAHYEHQSRVEARWGRLERRYRFKHRGGAHVARLSSTSVLAADEFAPLFIERDGIPTILSVGELPAEIKIGVGLPYSFGVPVERADGEPLPDPEC